MLSPKHSNTSRTDSVADRTYYLEMHNRDALRPSARNLPELEVRRVTPASAALNRFLYQTVGFQWNWVDRLPWTLNDWRDWVDRDELQTWIGWLKGAPVGYFELETQENEDVEISSFGLFIHFIGKGVGGPLLTETVSRAWDAGAERVWLHTCTLDHPRALDNYKARGFRIFREEHHDPDIVV